MANLNQQIYMDNHATTPVDSRVLEAMLPYFGERFGNAASRNHQFGWEAEEAVDRARRQVADLINASPKEWFALGGRPFRQRDCICFGWTGAGGSWSARCGPRPSLDRSRCAHCDTSRIERAASTTIGLGANLDAPWHVQRPL